MLGEELVGLFLLIAGHQNADRQHAGQPALVIVIQRTGNSFLLQRVLDDRCFLVTLTGANRHKIHIFHKTVTPTLEVKLNGCGLPHKGRAYKAIVT